MKEKELTEGAEKIIWATLELFMRFGIKSMTMDDIARQLGKSKKTLYQYFKDKNDLVQQCMETLVASEEKSAREMMEKHTNAIDLMFALTKDLSQKFNMVHPSINFDLQKYHPNAWQTFDQFSHDFVRKCAQQNIERGIEQGLFRKNIDPYVAAVFYAFKIHLCTDGQTFPHDKYSFQEIHLELMRYHIRGIASEKGLEYLKKKVKQEKIEL